MIVKELLLCFELSTIHTTTLTVWWVGRENPRWVGLVTWTKKVMTPKVMIMPPGMKKDQPQESLVDPLQPAQKEGMMVPRMLPTDVWEFQMPMIRPRLRREGKEQHDVENLSYTCAHCSGPSNLKLSNDSPTTATELL